jgi:hypothetical protein
MKTTQAWVWLTAGVLALGLNGIYHDGGQQWAHRMVAEAAIQANALLAPVAGRVDQFLAQAQMVASRNDTRSCRLSAAVTRIQASAARAHSGIARVEALSARQQAQMAQLEANRARIEAQAARAQFATMEFKDMEFNDIEFNPIEFDPMEFSAPDIHVNCPRVRVVVPQVPAIKPMRVVLPSAGPV